MQSAGVDFRNKTIGRAPRPPSRRRVRLDEVIQVSAEARGVDSRRAARSLSQDGAGYEATPGHRSQFRHRGAERRRTAAHDERVRVIGPVLSGGQGNLEWRLDVKPSCRYRRPYG